MSQISYVAAQPLFNLTVAEGNWVVKQLAAQGFSGATLFINPISSSGPAGSLIPVAEAASLGIPTNLPIYLQLQVPNKPDFYTAGLVAFDLLAGKTAAQALE